ncbi:ribonuclease 3-like [Diadema antillarum]|uniref:ribonuclease 3-like n=1 Tax=Diadema antillarum TaxID=105358 RepID=UPI003A83DE4E
MSAYVLDKHEKSARSRSPHRRQDDHRISDHSRYHRHRRSRSPSRCDRRRERSPSVRESFVRREEKRHSGPPPDPSKPSQRWNDLERKMKEEAEQLPDRESSLEPMDDSDQEGMDADNAPWIQCSPRENFYSTAPADQVNGSTVCAASKLKDLLKRFRQDIVERGPKVRSAQPQPETKKPELHWHVHSHHHSDSESSESDSESEVSSGEEDKEFDYRFACMKNRADHPWRLAENLWFNEPGEMNDGPLCKCSLKQQKTGITHNIYPGEGPILCCDPHSNNASRLHHYRVTVSPTANFLTTTQTVIVYDKREYIFEGFSIFAHQSLDEVPECKVVRFGREYTLHFFSEPMPENFTVEGLNLFSEFLFEEILELLDFDYKGKEDGCHFYHFMPRFARILPNNGKEILSMHHVIQHLIRSSRPIIDGAKLAAWLAVSETKWQQYVDKLRCMIATKPGRKPSSIRIDQLDRDQRDPEKVTFPVIVHFGVRPAQLSYIGDPEYRKLLKSYTRLRHLLLNKPTVTRADKEKLKVKEEKLQELRLKNSRTHEVTAEISSEGILSTGIGVDMCQHALMLPVLVSHLRYFACLPSLYKALDYKFKDPMLLRYALTHPSYKLYFGTNPDHVRNSLYNCGIRRKLEVTEHKKFVAKERKKGINQLYRIMSKKATDDDIRSHVKNYERLEFLGDAVIEFLSSTHLYHLFPDLEEGGLASYRVALVQNQHLSVLAKKLDLDKYMLYAHGPDLCRPYDLRHAMANCLEAVMGALYLEAGLDHVRMIFGKLLFENEHLQQIWLLHPRDPLQSDFPETDRHLIESSATLKKLTNFEKDTGIHFRHIRLLARAFTQRTVGYTNLTRGSNQRLEFLGDSVLQLVVSTYLYKHFPDHHEGHLSLLRSSLVNNKTQSIVAGDLGLVDYIIDTQDRYRNEKSIPMKIMADLVEALIGAMYVDHGLTAVETFCSVVFYPRLKVFIETQDWNDAKSQLQQCCLTLRVEGQEPDVPSYKVISQSGPTNSRQYSVAVYFRSKRMATGTASNIQDAQMEAAKNALKKGNFPHLWFQRKCLMRRRQQETGNREDKDRNEGSLTVGEHGENEQGGRAGGEKGSTAELRPQDNHGQRRHDADGRERQHSERTSDPERMRRGDGGYNRTGRSDGRGVGSRSSSRSEKGIGERHTSRRSNSRSRERSEQNRLREERSRIGGNVGGREERSRERRQDRERSDGGRLREEREEWRRDQRRDGRSVR